MNNLFAHGTGGVFIRPSARQSIHNHSGCVFAEAERMARYGLNDRGHRSQQNVSSQENLGADEVDNVMSKPAHPIRSPKPKNKQRRGSLEPMNNGHPYDADHENNALSQSVPTTLPSQYSSFSTEDDADESPVNRYDSHNSIRGNLNQSNNFGTPNSASSRSERSNLSSRSEESISERGFRQNNKTFFYKATVSFISGVVVLCGVVCSGGFNIPQMGVTKYDKSNFFTDLSALGEKYSIDSDSILKMQIGIWTIFEKEDTGSFIIVYNSKVKNFDSREFYKFVNDISLSAAKYLRNESRPVHYTNVDGARLDMDEHSEFLCRYREQLSHTGVMLLKNLEAVPSHLAMAFHYYCDEYNPLVRKSAVIFTLDLATCAQGKPTSSQSLHSTIEACLSERWRSIAPDSIAPLLARVVNVLVDVSHAF